MEYFKVYLLPPHHLRNTQNAGKGSIYLRASGASLGPPGLDPGLKELVFPRYAWSLS